MGGEGVEEGGCEFGVVGGVVLCYVAVAWGGGEGFGVVEGVVGAG